MGIFGFSPFEDDWGLVRLVYFFKTLLSYMSSWYGTVIYADTLIYPIFDPGYRITILATIFYPRYELFVVTSCIFYTSITHIWKGRHPLLFFFRKWVPWEWKARHALLDFYQTLALTIVLFSLVLAYGPCEFIPMDKAVWQWSVDPNILDGFRPKKPFRTWKTASQWEFTYFLFTSAWQLLMVVSSLYFYISFFLLKKFLSICKSSLFMKRLFSFNLFAVEIPFKYVFFFFKIFLDLLSLVFHKVSYIFDLEVWYSFLKWSGFCESYINMCLDFAIICTTLFTNEFFFKILVVFIGSSTVQIFFFNTFHYNVYVASRRYLHSVQPMKRKFVSNLTSRYASHYKSFIKWFSFRKFREMMTVQINTYNRRFHKWWEWNFYMKWFIKQKLKVKWYTRYFKLKINIGYLWTRHFFQYRSKHVRRRRRINQNQYRRFLKEHRRIRWNSWLTKVIGSVGNPGRFIRIRKKCGYMRSRKYLRRSSVAIWIGNPFHFAHDKTRMRLRLYGYMRMIYWGKDSPRYHISLIENLYSKSFPNVSSWSLTWLYPQVDVLRWTKPYVLRNISFYSSRSRTHDSFVWEHPEHFMTRYDRKRTWQVHSDFCRFWFEKINKIRLSRLIKKYVFNPIWHGVIPSMSDIYDISDMDLSSLKIPDTDSFIFNFFKNF